MRPDRTLALAFTAIAATGAAMAAEPSRTVDEVVDALNVAPAVAAIVVQEDDLSTPVGKQKVFSFLKSTPSTALSPQPAAKARAVAVAKAPRTAKRYAPAPVAAGPALDMRVAFEEGSAEMLEQAKAEARIFAEAMQKPELAAARFRVDGHTDSIGDRRYNLELSKRRAQAVVDFLVTQGADANRLIPVGHGFDRPRPGARPSDPANRRVEFARAG